MSPRPPFPPPARKPNKHRLFIGVMLAVVLLGGIFSFLSTGGKNTRKAVKREEIITITPMPPPPPPPPPPPKVEPPPPEDQPEEEMIAQEPVAEDEPPPEDAPPEAPPSEDLGTGIAGNGPDMGLTGKGSGGGNRIGGNGRRGGGSKFGWYAAKVQASIADAMRKNPITRNATMSGLEVRIWPDSSGRITRAQLVGTSGNPAVDQAIKNQVLTGYQLQAPPADMPTPIVLSLNARKSGT